MGARSSSTKSGSSRWGFRPSCFGLSQEREIQPLGGAPRKIDVRILAATNADLDEQIRDRSFRQDLYFRLAGYVLRVPPLAACREDLPYFAEAFLRRFAEERQVFPKGLSLGALRGLVAYPWPGNIRELEHEMRRLVLRCDPGQVIDSELLSPEILEPNPPGEASPLLPEETLNLKQRLEEVEAKVIREALEATDGIQLRAAELLGISPQWAGPAHEAVGALLGGLAFPASLKGSR